MNRRQFIGGSAAAAAGAALAADPILNMDYSTVPVKAEGPYGIEIVSPPEEAVRELPLFDSYKQAENFAQARMHILRTNQSLCKDDVKYVHEAGLIKVWTANNKVVFECAWGETWTMSHSYVDANSRSV